MQVKRPHILHRRNYTNFSAVCIGPSNNLCPVNNGSNGKKMNMLTGNENFISNESLLYNQKEISAVCLTNKHQRLSYLERQTQPLTMHMMG